MSKRKYLLQIVDENGNYVNVGDEHHSVKSVYDVAEKEHHGKRIGLRLGSLRYHLGRNLMHYFNRDTANQVWRNRIICSDHHHYPVNT